VGQDPAGKARARVHHTLSARTGRDATSFQYYLFGILLTLVVLTAIGASAQSEIAERLVFEYCIIIILNVGQSVRLQSLSTGFEEVS